MSPMLFDNGLDISRITSGEVGPMGDVFLTVSLHLMPCTQSI